MEVCPCKDCKPPKRNPYCHKSCKDYLSWNQQNIQRRSDLYKESQERRDYLAHVIRLSKRFNRK